MTSTAMTSNLSRAAWNAMSASHPVADVRELEGDARELRHTNQPGVTDILSIGANPVQVLYLSELFQQFGWTVRPMENLRDAADFLEEHEAQVAICEETFAGGTWRDASRMLSLFPDSPMLVVIGSDRALLDEVLAAGGFDVLTRPLRESDVVWTVASAWHQWMKLFHGPEEEGPLCSDA